MLSRQTASLKIELQDSPVQLNTPLVQALSAASIRKNGTVLRFALAWTAPSLEGAIAPDMWSHRRFCRTLFFL